MAPAGENGMASGRCVLDFGIRAQRVNGGFNELERTTKFANFRADKPCGGHAGVGVSDHKNPFKLLR